MGGAKKTRMASNSISEGGRGLVSCWGNESCDNHVIESYQ